MKYIIEKGSLKRSKYMFIFTGTFLIVLFSYQLYDYLQTNEFIDEFPGDWDKPIGIAVGLFLLLRTRKFIVGSRDIFVEISPNQLRYRKERSESIRKISLSDVKEVHKKAGKIILTSKDSTQRTIVDFNNIRMKDDKRKLITKSIIEGLNKH